METLLSFIIIGYNGGNMQSWGLRSDFLLSYNLSMKRVNTRGLQQANKHVLMAALAYNLKKYMNYIRKIKIPTTMGEIKDTNNQCFSSIFDFFAALSFINLHNRTFSQISYQLL
jgi:hypothetical protein